MGPFPLPPALGSAASPRKEKSGFKPSKPIPQELGTAQTGRGSAAAIHRAGNRRRRGSAVATRVPRLKPHPHCRAVSSGSPQRHRVPRHVAFHPGHGHGTEVHPTPSGPSRVSPCCQPKWCSRGPRLRSVTAQTVVWAATELRGLRSGQGAAAQQLQTPPATSPAPGPGSPQASRLSQRHYQPRNHLTTRKKPFHNDPEAVLKTAATPLSSCNGLTSEHPLPWEWYPASPRGSPVAGHGLPAAPGLWFHSPRRARLVPEVHAVFHSSSVKNWICDRLKWLHVHSHSFSFSSCSTARLNKYVSFPGLKRVLKGAPRFYFFKH